MNIQQFFQREHKTRKLKLLSLAAMSLAFSATRAQVPVISSISAESGIPGSTITISGSNFNSTASNNIVFFGATKATVNSGSSTSLSVTVPDGATVDEPTVTDAATGLMTSTQYPFLPTWDNSAYVSDIINFSDVATFAASASTGGVATGDIDGDGKPDVAAVSTSTATIGVYLNTGSAGHLSFATAVEYSGYSSPQQLAIGDLDGDGKPDLVVCDYNGYKVSVFRNTCSIGSVSFSSRVDYSTSGRTRGPVLTDLDGDGRPEVLVTTFPSSVEIFRNTSSIGSISLASSTTITSASYPFRLTTTDLDGDGKQDVIAAASGSDVLSIFRNVSSAGSLSFETRMDVAVGDEPRGVRAADFDGDGLPDLVVNNYSGHSISILHNSSSSGSVSFDTTSTFSIGTAPNTLTLADLNGDGKTDICASLIASSDMFIMRNASSSGNISFVTTSVSAAGNPGDVTAGDLDGDGKPDLVYAQQTGSYFSVLQNSALEYISGPASVCVSSTISLSNGTSGGTWSSSATGIATVDETTGLVTGVTAGTATISYTVTGGSTTTTITVNATPDAGSIVGTATLCIGDSRTLSATASGGVWSSASSAIAAVDSTGGVTGMASGTSTVSYTVDDGCSAVATTVVTVNASPLSISGASSVNAGNSITLANSVPGGAWTSSDVAVATVGSATGIVTGIATGTATISYAMAGGCYRTRLITVSDTTGPITGHTRLCVGDAYVLSCSLAPGTAWTSSDTAIATIGTYSGLVHAVSPGTTTISFTTLAGAVITRAITINSLPAAITGTTAVCSGSTTALSSSTSGGTWSNSSPFFASVDESSGVVSGIAAGSVTVTYTSSEGCMATATVTVGLTPHAIYGTTSLCIGSAASLASGTTGCTWSSSDTAVVTVSSGGLVTGIDSGSATITVTYSASGCTATTSVAVGNYMTAITGGGEPDAGGIAYVIAGNGVSGSSGDGGPASSATVNTPFGMARDAAGNLYVCQKNANKIRKISADGTITLIAGTGTTGFAGDGGPATAANLYHPTGIAVDASGNLYFADSDNDRVRKIDGSGIITTIAGTGHPGFTGDGGPATDARVGFPTGVTIDLSGNVLIADQGNDRVRKIDTSGTITTVAGTGTSGYNGDNIAATAAQLNQPKGLTIDASGNLYIAESVGARVRKVDASGIITTVAGDGTEASSGDGGPATAASLQGAEAITFDNKGNLYVSEHTSGKIRKVGVDGVISTFVGTGTTGYSGDSMAATATMIGQSNGMLTDEEDNLYFSDRLLYRIWKVTGPTDGGVLCIGQTISLSDDEAGGTWTSSNAGVASVNASTGLVSGVGAGSATITYASATGCYAITTVTVNTTMASITGASTVCVGDTTTLSSATTGGTWSSSSSAVCAIDPVTGLATGIAAGTVTITYKITGGCIKTRSMTVVGPSAITGASSVCEGSTTVLSGASGSGWSSSNTAVATIGSSSGVLTGVAAGTASISFTTIYGCVSTTVATVQPLPEAITGTTTVCSGSTATLACATTGGAWSSSAATFASVDAASGIVTGIAEGSAVITYTTAEGCTATTTVTVGLTPHAIYGTTSLCTGSSASLASATTGCTWSSSDTAIATVSATGVVTGIDSGSATITVTYSASGCAATTSVAVGNYMSAIIGGGDSDAGGIAYVIAGNGTPTYSGDGGLATSAGVRNPHGIARDAAGNTYVCQIYNNIIRKVSSDGTISTFAGTGTAAYSGDGGPATAAELNGPKGICIDTYGNIYIADASNQRIRKIDPTGVITTVAGTGASGFAGDSGPATDAKLANPADVTIDVDGNLLIADDNNGRIRKIDPTGIISTIAGGGLASATGDGIPATSAGLSHPVGVAADASGNVYFAELTGRKVRKIDASGTVYTVAGNGADSSYGDGGPATAAGVYGPIGVALDNSGNLYLTELGNAAIRKVTTDGIITRFAGTGVSGYIGDGIPATSALIGTCYGITVDDDGTVYFADELHHRIWKVTVASDGGTLCVGQTITLSDAEAGGSWTSSNTSVASVNTSTGVVTGMSAGTAAITYGSGTGCYATTIVTVNATMASITGASTVCVGSTATLYNTTSGGTWSSDATAICTIDSSTGVVTGIAAGVATITYEVTAGCIKTRLVTVVSPSTITGTASLCEGSTTVLSGVSGSGWSSSNTAVATIGSSSGVLTGVGAGTADISFTTTYGCVSTTVATVHALPDAITGTTSVCSGSATTLSCATTGGTWSSSGPSFASVDTASGTVTGIAAGSAIISYTTTDGCLATTTVTVGLTPHAIYGTTSLCTGSSASLASATTGCTWSSSDESIATVSSTGVVTGIDSGSATITVTYSASGCSATTSVAVGNYMTAITGGGEPDAGGIAYVIAGTGSGSHTGDNGPASAASLYGPIGITRDAAGNLYVGERAGNTIRKISTDGTITTIAGTGTAGYSGDGGPATAAELQTPSGLAVDGYGNIYFVQNPDNVIRKIDTAGIITTFAGTGTSGFSGDGGPATAAALNGPEEIAFDPWGNLMVADQSNNRIRKIDGSGIISTVAGTGVAGYNGDGIAATAATLRAPVGVAVDAAGNLYIGDTYNSRVRKVDASGTISTYAGDGTMAASGDGGPATAASIYRASRMAFDNDGNLYVSQNGYASMRKVGTDGIITTFIGTGTTGYNGDGLPATATQINVAAGITADNAGNIYFVDYGLRRVRKVTSASGGVLCVGETITLSETETGGTWSSSNHSVASVNASTGVVTGIATGYVTISYASAAGCYATTTVTVNTTMASIMGAATVCIGGTTTLTNATSGGTWSTSATAICTIDESSGEVTGISAGTATITYTITGGCVRTRTMTVVGPVAITNTANVCAGSATVLSAASSGSGWTSSDISVATIGLYSGLVTGVAAGTADITFTSTYGCVSTTVATVQPLPEAITGTTTVCSGSTTTLACATTGGTWSSSAPAFASVDAASGIVTGIAEGSAVITYTTAGGCTATTTVTVGLTPHAIYGTTSLCTGSSASLASATTGCTWSSSDTTIATVSSGGVVTGIDSGSATITVTYSASGCAATTSVAVGSYMTAITGGGDPDAGGIAYVIGGNGGNTTTGDGGLATSAAIGGPRGITRDAAGNTYVCELYNNVIRKISTDSTITTFAGTGTSGFSGDGGPATAADIYRPTGIAADAYGNVYFADQYNHRIRKIDASGTITTVAGTGTAGFSGDGGPATSADLKNPSDVAVDAYGQLWVADYNNHRVRKVDAAGVITTIAGTAADGYNGDGIMATAADLKYPTGVTVDAAGNVYIADISARRVRKVDTSGIIYTVAGNGTDSSYGDGGPATDAGVKGPTGVAVDYSGNLYIAEYNAAVVRKVSTDGIISRFAGTGVSGYIGDGIPATTAQIGTAYGITVDYDGTVYFTDAVRHRVWEVTTETDGGVVCIGQTISLSDTATGGTWSSSNSHANINATTGLVTGVSAGTATITYSGSSGCYATTIVTVNATMSSITGATTVCVGSTTTLSNATAGGTWSTNATDICTIDAGVGLVTGAAAGTATITYASSGGCMVTRAITVTTGVALTGSASLCEGSTTVLSAGSTGSGWTSGNTSIATIGSSSGMVTGIAAGTAEITFTSSSGCASTEVVTINPLPEAISGTLTVCKTATTTLSCASTGGTWSSSNTAKAGVGASTGVVTGVNTGSATIYYTLSTGCKSQATVTVNPLPDAGAITGVGNVSNGGSITITPTVSGGIWTSENPAIATVTPASGSSATLTGVSLGSVWITYTVTNSCGSAFRRRRFNVVSAKTINGETSDWSAISVRMYPNPAKETLTVETPVSGTLVLFGLDGRQISQYSIPASISAISLPDNLADGVYMFHFSGSDGSEVIMQISVLK